MAKVMAVSSSQAKAIRENIRLEEDRKRHKARKRADAN